MLEQRHFGIATFQVPGNNSARARAARAAGPTWGRDRLRRRPSVVDQDLAGVGRGVSPAQAPCGHQLADGRDVHQSRRPVEVPVPSRRPYRCHDRLCASCPPRLRCGEAILRTRHRAARCAGDDHHRQELRQSKYLNNIIEQDHRAIKLIARPMLGFKSFRCASILIAGIETMHMIKKGPLDRPKAQASTAASQFYSLAL